MKEIVQQICITARGIGSTTHLLKMAIKNPKVIIIFHNQEYANNSRGVYESLLQRENWVFRLRLWIKKKLGIHIDAPMFISQHNQQALFTGIKYFRRPIIFDNSCFI